MFKSLKKVVAVITLAVSLVAGLGVSASTQTVQATSKKHNAVIYVNVNGACGQYAKPSRNSKVIVKRAGVFATRKTVKKHGEKWYQLTNKKYVPASDAQKTSKLGKYYTIKIGDVIYYYVASKKNGNVTYRLYSAIC